jgi:hypothetical protein
MEINDFNRGKDYETIMMMNLQAYQIYKVPSMKDEVIESINKYMGFVRRLRDSGCTDNGPMQGKRFCDLTDKQLDDMGRLLLEKLD